MMLELLSSSPSPLHWLLFHLSSLMNRCCSAAGVNMMDWVAGRHILPLRESERGHLDSEKRARVLWIFCVSHLLSSLLLPLISDIQESFLPKPHPQLSTTHQTVHLSPCQPFCSTDHPSVMCPCLQSEKLACEKVKKFIIRSTLGVEGEDGNSHAGVW